MMEIIIGIHRENASFLGLTSVEHPAKWCKHMIFISL